MKQKLPWIIAAMAVAFAVVVVLQGRMQPRAQTGASPEPTTRIQSQQQPGPTPYHQPEPRNQNPPVRNIQPLAAMTETPATPEVVQQRPGHILTGVVTDLNGTGIPNATLTLFFNVSSQQEKKTYRTDGKGVFTAAGIQWPQVDLFMAEATGFAPYVSKVAIPLPLDIPLEISLHRLGGTQLRVYTVAGGSSPSPFTGEATVSVLKQKDDVSTAGATSSSKFFTLFTEPANITNGDYVIKDLKPGTYMAAVLTAEDYAESAPFTVQNGQAGEATITLGKRVSFVGIVKSAAAGQPIPQASAILAVLNRPITLGKVPPGISRSASDGRFQFDGISPGSYELTLSAEGYTTKSLTVAIASDNQGAPSEFILMEGVPTLAVTVLDGPGKPMPMAPLVVFSSGSGPARSFFGKTESNGVARFGKIPAGRYIVAATSPTNRARQKTAEVEIREGEPASVQIHFAQQTRVSVVAKRKGVAYQGLLVISPRASVGGQQLVKADENGSFAIDLEPGEYVVRPQGENEGEIITVPNLPTANLEFDVKS